MIGSVGRAFIELRRAGTETAEAVEHLGAALRAAGFAVEVDRLERRARFLHRYHRRGRAIRRRP